MTKADGQRSHIEDLYYKHYASIFRFAFSIMQNEEDAKDITGDVFACLWEKWSEDTSMVFKMPYLLSLTRSRCIDRIRKNKMHQNYVKLSAIAMTDTNEDPSLLEEKLQRVSKAINELKEPTRTVLWYCYFKKLTYRQTAEALDMSLSAVKKSMQKAFTCLRDCLNN